MKINICLVVMFLFSTFLYSQNTRIVFEITQKPDKNNKDFVEKDLAFLDILPQQSYYYFPEKVEFADKPEQVAKLKSSYTIEKDKNNIYYYLDLDQFYAYKEKLDLRWKILKEKQTILEHICQKAETEFRGRKYIVWFAEDIPFSEGPFKFHGLPGLILSAKSEDGDYIFEAIQIKNIETTEVKIPQQVKLLKRDKYLKLLKDIAENPSKVFLNNPTGSVDQTNYVNGKEVNDQEMHKQFNEFIWNFMKTHNNPIETDDIWIR